MNAGKQALGHTRSSSGSTRGRKRSSSATASFKSPAPPRASEPPSGSTATTASTLPPSTPVRGADSGNSVDSIGSVGPVANPVTPEPPSYATPQSMYPISTSQQMGYTTPITSSQPGLSSPMAPYTSSIGGTPTAPFDHLSLQRNGPLFTPYRSRNTDIGPMGAVLSRRRYSPPGGIVTHPGVSHAPPGMLYASPVGMVPTSQPGMSAAEDPFMTLSNGSTGSLTTPSPTGQKRQGETDSAFLVESPLKRQHR